MTHQALLSKSAVSPSDVLFVDDAEENVQSVRPVHKQHMGYGHALAALTTLMFRSRVPGPWVCKQCTCHRD